MKRYNIITTETVSYNVYVPDDVQVGASNAESIWREYCDDVGDNLHTKIDSVELLEVEDWNWDD